MEVSSVRCRLPGKRHLRFPGLPGRRYPLCPEFIQGAGGGGCHLLQGQLGVELLEPLLGHGKEGEEGLHGVPCLHGVREGPGEGASRGLGQFLGGGLGGVGGEILVADVHLAADVQGSGFGGGVVLFYQVQGLGDGLSVGSGADLDAIHRQGI